MTIFNPPSLIKHVVSFCGPRVLVTRTVGIDVMADRGKEIYAGAGVGDGGAEAGEIAAMVEEDFAVA